MRYGLLGSFAMPAKCAIAVLLAAAMGLQAGCAAAVPEEESPPLQEESQQPQEEEAPASPHTAPVGVEPSDEPDEGASSPMVSGGAHLTKVAGTVEAVFPSTNSIEVSITSDASGFFDVERDVFFCDETFCDVSCLSKGDEVTIECVIPNDERGKRRASRVYASGCALSDAPCDLRSNGSSQEAL